MTLYRFVYMLPAIAFALFFLLEIALSAEPTKDLISEMHEIKLKIAHLESVLEENNQKLNQRNLYLSECKNRIDELSEKVQQLQSTLSGTKDDSLNADRRLKALEEEVRLLWSTLRRKNFDLHILESKAQDAENRLEEVTLVVEKMGDIVTEQWVQIQHLEQALHITKMRALKVQRQAGIRRCTFLKFISNIRGDLSALSSYVFGEKTMRSSLISDAMGQLKRSFSMAKKYHHELQGFIKDLMKRYEFTAIFAHDELVFFLASALITFPVMSAWMLLSS